MSDDVGARIISLPLFDSMTAHDLVEVVTVLREEMARFAKPVRSRARRPLKRAPAPLVPVPSAPHPTIGART